MFSFTFSFSLFLSFLYSSIFFVSLLQLSRILHYRHNVKSFHFAFLLLTFCWSLLRIFFFGSTLELPAVVALALFWLPGDFQFASFSLIVVFLEFLLNRQIWPARRPWILLIYGILNISIFLFTFLFLSISCFIPVNGALECAVSERLERTHHAYVFLQFCLLLTAYGNSLYQLYHQNRENRLTGLTGLSGFVWLCFFTRCIYCLFAALGLFSIEVGGNSGGLKDVSLISFILLIFWEILPMLLFLVYFRHIPASRARSKRSNSIFGPSPANAENSNSKPSPLTDSHSLNERSALLFHGNSNSSPSPASLARDLDRDLLADYYGSNAPEFSGAEESDNCDLDSIFHPLRLPLAFVNSPPDSSGSIIPPSYAAFDSPMNFEVDPALIPPFHSNLFAPNLYANYNDQYFQGRIIAQNYSNPQIFEFSNSNKKSKNFT